MLHSSAEKCPIASNISLMVKDALCEAKIVAARGHRGVDLLTEGFVALVLWKVKF